MTTCGWEEWARRSARGPVRHALHLATRSGRAVRDADYRRALLARTVTRALARISPQVRYLGVLDGGELTFVHLADSVITPWILATGEFQRKDFQSACFETRRLVPFSSNGIFVDVGANVGTTTLYAMRSGQFRRAISMEPAPENVDLLRLNLLANGLTERVDVLPVACTADTGTAELWLTSGNKGDHRMARDAAAPSTHETTLTVETMTLDAAIRSCGADPSEVELVWVDTQGHEPAVLAGASDVIAAGAPFCIEFWPGEYQRSGTLESILQLIEGCFISFVDLGESALPVRSTRHLRDLTVELISSSGQTDIVLVPPPPVGAPTDGD